MEIYEPQTTADFLLSVPTILNFLLLTVCLFVICRWSSKERHVTPLSFLTLAWVGLHVLYIPYMGIFSNRWQWAGDFLGYWFSSILYPLEQIALNIPILILIFLAYKRSPYNRSPYNRSRYTSKPTTKGSSRYVGLDLD